jgi:hypothetical protein
VTNLHTLSALAFVLTAACGDVTEDDPNPDNPDAGVELDAPEPDAPMGIAVAPADNDSLQNPAQTHFLSITGTRDFAYTNEISFPMGDAEDFLEFEFPNNQNPAQVVRITLACTLTGDEDAVGTVEIFEDAVLGNLRVDCNEGEQTLTVDNTKVQTARVRFSSAGATSHLAYTLTVVGFQ